MSWKMRSPFWSLLLILSGILISLSAHSGVQSDRYRLTRCLGREELNLHRTKEENYNYYLNQTLQTYFVEMDGVTLKDEYYLRACSNRKGNSFKILEILLTHFEKSFKYLPEVKSRELNKSLAMGFIRNLPEIFNRFMIHVKKHAGDVKCLNKYIPELKRLEQNILDLQGHLHFKKIIWRDDLIKKILSKLSKQEYFYNKCPKKKKTKK